MTIHKPSFSSIKKAALAIALASVVVLAPAAANAASYTVVRGDSLDKIARAHGTNWRALQAANPSIKNPNRIYVGNTINIPEAGQAPAPVAAQTAQAGLTGCELARSLINQYDWNTTTAYNVMVAESTCYAGAENMNDYHSFAGCWGSYGLFGINCSHGIVKDPAQNVAIAYSMWKQSGWSPWQATTCRVKVVCS